MEGKQLKCKYCGYNNNEIFVFCPVCGKKQKKTVSSKKKMIIALSVNVVIFFFLFLILLFKYPNVCKLNIKEATKLLEENGIKYTIEYDNYQNYVSDTVVNQDVDWTSSTIHLKVCKEQVFKLPNIVGRNIEDVNDKIDKMPINRIYKYSDNIKNQKGEILWTSIDEGELFTKSDNIKMYICKGIRKKTPNISKLNINEAKKLLKKYNLSYEIKYKFSSQTKGNVISYSPLNYTDDSNTIYITVSKGKGYKVPNVEKKLLSDAEKILKKAGVEYDIKYAYSGVSNTGVNNYTPIVSKQSKSGLLEKKQIINLKVIKPAVYINEINFQINTVGGVDTAINFSNNTDKSIDYVTFSLQYFDSVGNPAFCSIRNTSIAKLKLTGPIKPFYTGEVKYDAAIYNSTISAVMPLLAKVEFSDGSEAKVVFDKGDLWNNEFFDSSKINTNYETSELVGDYLE